MTIVLNEMLVIFLGREVYVHRLFIRAAGHAPKLRKSANQTLIQTIDTSVLQNYTGPRGLVNLVNLRSIQTPPGNSFYNVTVTGVMAILACASGWHNCLSSNAWNLPFGPR